jgi:hypothetical protein
MRLSRPMWMAFVLSVLVVIMFAAFGLGVLLALTV